MISRKRMSTQADVARLASVSTATVSRVLNNRGVITPEVRCRVRDAMATLQYVPHAGARALATQRTGALGAIIPSLNNAVFAQAMSAFERTAQRLGYTLILSVSQQDPEQENVLVRKMIERGVDGLLLVGNQHDERVFDQLEHAGLRHVCTWAYDQNFRAANVGFDNARSMFAVVDHLVELGHVRIGMLAGETEHNDRARDRIKGVRSRLQFHGLDLPEHRLVQVPYCISSSRRGFWRVIDQDITAVICGSDSIAYGALLEAQKTGLRVPEDLSITGFGNLSLSAELCPALTTVEVPAQDMGEKAARRLIAAVEGRGLVASTELETRLIIRETTGTLRAKAA